MDFISLFLSLFGLGRDHANRVSDRRAEIARLNAEVAGEVGLLLDILNSTQPGLLRRCATLYPDMPQMVEQVKAVLDAQRGSLVQIMKMTEDNSALLASRRGADWDLLLHRMLEWRATTSRVRPQVQDILARLEKGIIDDERNRKR